MTPRLALAAIGALLVAPPVSAQRAVLRGRVVEKSSRTPLSGAEVHVTPGAMRTLSDASGNFRFDAVAPGHISILVRHLGFQPESAAFAVAPAEHLEVVVELRQAAQPLDTVSVTGREVSLAERKLAGFQERRRFGIGRFFDTQTLEKEKNRKLGEFITSRTPGSRLVRSRLGSAAWVATTRIGGGLTLLGGSRLEESDLHAGADPRACYPDVYVDGALLYAHGSRSSLFDINSYSTNDVAAVEFYVSASQTPVQFNRTGAACGVLAIWTR